MSDTCPKCGAYCGLARGCVSAQLREQLAKAEAEVKRYREAWSDVRDALIIDREFWNNKNANREVQISSTILRMDDLILSSEDHP